MKNYQKALVVLVMGVVMMLGFTVAVHIVTAEAYQITVRHTNFFDCQATGNNICAQGRARTVGTINHGRVAAQARLYRQNATATTRLVTSNWITAEGRVTVHTTWRELTNLPGVFYHSRGAATRD